MKNKINFFVLVGSLLSLILAKPSQAQFISTEEYSVVTVAGSGSVLGNGGPATAALLTTPGLVTFDAFGNFYLIESFGHRVRKVDIETGIITTVVGTGLSGSTGDGGQAKDARINVPRGILFDSWGNFYVAETSGHRVRKVTARVVQGIPQPLDGTEAITTIVNTDGIAGSTGDGGTAAAARINGAAGIVLDDSGNLYVVELNGQRIRKVTARVIGNVSQPFDGSEIISTVVGTGQAGSGGDLGPAVAAQLNLPNIVDFDTSGNLYIAEVNGHRIRKVIANLVGGFAQPLDGTEIIDTVAGTGTAGYNGDNIQATSARINAPRAVTTDILGNFYIADFLNHRLRKVDANGMISTVVGTGVAGFNGDGGVPEETQLNGPNHVAFDSSGNPYIAEPLSGRIRRVNLAVTLNTDPDTLNLGSAGQFLSAMIQIPAERDPAEVDVASLKLQAIDPNSGTLRHSATPEVFQTAIDPDAPVSLVDTNFDNVADQLIVKFDRGIVATWADGSHVLALRVEGKFQDGRYFSGDTEIRLKYPKE